MPFPKFSSIFFKSFLIQTFSGVLRSNTPSACLPQRKSRRTATVKPTVSGRLFFFSWSNRRKRNRTKKRSAVRAFRALRSAPRALPLNRDLLKKVDQNFNPDNAWLPNTSLIKTPTLTVFVKIKKSSTELFFISRQSTQSPPTVRPARLNR